MYTIVTLIMFCLTIIVIWRRHHKSYVDLSLNYLWITPFLALLSLIDHNLDHDKISPYIRILPYILIMFTMGVSVRSSLLLRKSRSFWSGFSCLVVYAFLSWLQIFYAIRPDWAIVTWFWVVPGYILFFIAGYETPLSKLTQSKNALWVILGFTSIGIFLRFYAIYIGRVDAAGFWYTRGYGSIYASGIVIIATYGGMAWLQIRDLSKYKFLFILLCLLTPFTSMSRSSIVILFMFIALLFFPDDIHKFCLSYKNMLLGVLASGILFLCVLFFIDTPLIVAITSSWENRFQGLATSFFDWGIRSMQVRFEEFGDIYQKVFEDYLFKGEGIGQYYFSSNTGYSDAHNLFFTECYENGVLATLFLYALFFIGTFYACLGMFRPKMAPLSVSFLVCMLIVHTGGNTLIEKGFAQYITPYAGWVFFFIIGRLISQRA